MVIKESGKFDNRDAERKVTKLLSDREDVVAFKETQVMSNIYGLHINFFVAPTVPISPEAEAGLNALLNSLIPQGVKPNERTNFELVEGEVHSLIHDEDIKELLKSVQRRLIFGRLVFIDSSQSFGRRKAIVKINLFPNEAMAEDAYHGRLIEAIQMDLGLDLKVRE